MQKVIQAKYGHLRAFNPVATSNSKDSAERMLCTVVTPACRLPVFYLHDVPRIPPIQQYFREDDPFVLSLSTTSTLESKQESRHR